MLNIHVVQVYVTWENGQHKSQANQPLWEAIASYAEGESPVEAHLVHLQRALRPASPFHERAKDNQAAGARGGRQKVPFESQQPEAVRWICQFESKVSTVPFPTAGASLIRFG